MSEWSRSFEFPDEVIEAEDVREQVVRMAGITVGRYVLQPGWRWSTHVKPNIGTDLCEARHVGVSLAGRLGVLLSDSTTYSIHAGEVFLIPAGHDIWVEGDEAAETIEWAGALAWHPGPEGLGDRRLVTLLMSDIVESTATAERIGDRRWSALLKAHDESTSEVVNRFHGEVVKGTGDGTLAMFNSAQAAVQAGMALGREIQALGLQVRVGVHTGEVDVVAGDIHGVAVHELARITGVANAEEVLVSGTTASLAGAAIAQFVPRGEHELRGLAGTHALFAAEPI